MLHTKDKRMVSLGQDIYEQIEKEKYLQYL